MTESDDLLAKLLSGNKVRPVAYDQAVVLLQQLGYRRVVVEGDFVPNEVTVWEHPSHLGPSKWIRLKKHGKPGDTSMYGTVIDKMASVLQHAKDNGGFDVKTTEQAPRS
jgi:hypothetical protein